MVTIEIVIKSTLIMGIHVTISCRYCIAFEVMLLFSNFYFISQEVWEVKNKMVLDLHNKLNCSFTAFTSNQ